MPHSELNLNSTKKRKRLWLAAAPLAFAAVLLVSLSVGRYTVPLWDTILILTDRLISLITGGTRGLADAFSEQSAVVITQIRFPRVLAAAVIGCGLSVSGTVYQSMFKNPMVSPDILGASAGAGFGAALGILLRFGSVGITATAFLAGLLAVGMGIFAARRFKGDVTLGLVLAGLMAGSLFQAGTSFIKLVADPADQLPAITYWLMGSLASIRISDLWVLLPIVVLSAAPIFLMSWRLNVLTLEDGEARALGLNTGLLRMVLVVCATLITAACVAVSGMIGWVGLFVPHMARRAVGNDLRLLLPVAALMGGAFLMAADDLARTVLASEIPIGILTAFVGAPFFLFLIMGGGADHKR